MKTRQNRWNGGIIGNEDYLAMNGMLSSTQNYTRNVGCYASDIPNYSYTRPSEWVSLPGMTQGDQIFAGVFAVYDNDSNFVAFTVSGNYTVNWGDGTTSAHTAATTAYKRYDRTTYAGLTSSVYNNYKTLVIRITPTGSASLTSINLVVKHNQPNLPTYANQWLDIKCAGATLSTLGMGTDNDAAIKPLMLEQFEFVGTNVITNMNGMFANAICLRNIVSLHTNSATSMARMHWNNYALGEIPLYNTLNVTNFESMFQNCIMLKTVPQFNTSRATNTSGMFAYCRSLARIPPLDTQLVTTMDSMFTGCYGLLTVPWMNTRSVTRIVNMFYNCIALRKIPHFNFSNVTNWQGAFGACTSLEEIPPFDFSKATNLVFTFGGSWRINKLPVLNTTSALTSIYLMFGYGSSIREITFTNTTNCTNFNGAFIYCYRLKKINGLDTTNATDLGGIFSQCFSLEEAPFLRFDNLVNGSNVFYGSNVRILGNTYLFFPKANTIEALFRFNGNISEIPPIDAPNALNMAYAFQNNYSLHTIKGLTLAQGASLASFNAAGFQNTFDGCHNLTNVPRLNLAGLSAAGRENVFLNMFANCRSIANLNGITGINYNISLAGQKLSATALNEIYAGLGVVGASGAGVRTITVTTNWGASAALGHNPAIAIGKGWTVTA